MPTVPVRRFRGSVALVLGGAGVVGAATCARLAAEGARVWVADSRPEGSHQVADSLPDAVACDFQSVDDIDRVVSELLTQEDRIDVLVNCTEAVRPQSADWTDSLDITHSSIMGNLAMVYGGCRSVLPQMFAQRHGTVVNFASDAALVGWPSYAAYGAGEAAVIGLTRGAAIDAAEYGVRVNCVCVSLLDVATPGIRSGSADHTGSNSLLQRSSRPQETAAAIAFLASDEAAFVTGITLAVNGGATAR
jgi:meso-butanediol dehydrogenase/(S,S)-butanediol dehydrogenase/diacetyl reductase